MRLARALEIVLELARQNVIDDPEMEEERAEQEEAIRVIEGTTEALKAFPV